MGGFVDIWRCEESGKGERMRLLWLSSGDLLYLIGDSVGDEA
jgi:hypothetical protein